MSPRLSGALSAVRRNPKKTLAALALGAGALGAGMYTGYIPSPQWAKDAGNAVLRSETMGDLRRGFSHGQDFTQGAGSFTYHGGRALGELAGHASNLRQGLSNSLYNQGSQYRVYPNTAMFQQGYNVGEFVRQNPRGIAAALGGLSMASIARMTVAARRKKVVELQRILDTTPTTREEAIQLQIEAPVIREAIQVLSGHAAYRPGYGRSR